MLKQSGVRYLIFFIVVAIAQKADAHAINQHLEEFYGNSYLPIFIFAKLLPFIGLGFLTKKINRPTHKKQIEGIFILGTVLGLIVGFLDDDFGFVLLINNFSLIVCGAFLIVSGHAARVIIHAVIIFFGLTLGYEHGLYLSHAHNFTWLYLSVFVTALAIFTILNYTRIVPDILNNTFYKILGVFLILFGIVAVLLS